MNSRCQGPSCRAAPLPAGIHRALTLAIARAPAEKCRNRPLRKPGDRECIGCACCEKLPVLRHHFLIPLSLLRQTHVKAPCAREKTREAVDQRASAPSLGGQPTNAALRTAHPPCSAANVKLPARWSERRPEAFTPCQSRESRQNEKQISLSKERIALLGGARRRSLLGWGAGLSFKSRRSNGFRRQPQAARQAPEQALHAQRLSGIREAGGVVRRPKRERRRWVECFPIASDLPPLPAWTIPMLRGRVAAPEAMTAADEFLSV